MVLGEKRRYNYNLKDDQIAITRLRDKYKQRNRTRIKLASKFSCVFALALFFFLCTLLLIQHSRVSTMNMEILKIEKELKEVQMINDSKEGILLSSLDLDSIEQTAKDKLGMVEPIPEQYSYLAVSDSNLKASVSNGTDTSKEDRAMGSWFTRLVD